MNQVQKVVNTRTWTSGKLKKNCMQPHSNANVTVSLDMVAYIGDGKRVLVVQFFSSFYINLSPEIVNILFWT